jgi:ferrous iron transport protein A
MRRRGDCSIGIGVDSLDGLTKVMGKGDPACQWGSGPLGSRRVSETRADEIGVDEHPDSFVCPLTQVQPGTRCRIKQLLASPELAHRLRELGFCEEQQIRLLTQERTMICQVCNARLGISAQLAEAILVQPIRGSRRAA